MNVSDMIDIKHYTFRELVLEYGPGHLNTVKVLWNAGQGKFNLIFGGVQVRIHIKLNQIYINLESI
jgi:hypothetical protein